MKYYRIIFRSGEDGIPEWTDIIEAEMSDEDFQKMNWEKPIIRHLMENQTHFISLDQNYLDAMLLGIRTFKDHEKILQVATADQGT